MGLIEGDGKRGGRGGGTTWSPLDGTPPEKVRPAIDVGRAHPGQHGRRRRCAAALNRDHCSRRADRQTRASPPRAKLETVEPSSGASSACNAHQERRHAGTDLNSCRGTEFADTLAKIREAPGRKYDGDRKLWLAPGRRLARRPSRSSSMIRPTSRLSHCDWIQSSASPEMVELTTPLPDDAELSVRGRSCTPFQRAFVDHAAAERQRLVLKRMTWDLVSYRYGLWDPHSYRLISRSRDGEPGDAIISGTHAPHRTSTPGRRSLPCDALGWDVHARRKLSTCGRSVSSTDVARGGRAVLTTERLGGCRDAAGNRRWRACLWSNRSTSLSARRQLEPYYMGVLPATGRSGTATPHISNHHDDGESSRAAKSLTTDAIRGHHPVRVRLVCGRRSNKWALGPTVCGAT